MHSSAPRAHSSSLVLRDDSDGVARITLNRPDGLNALSMAVLEALESVLGDLAGDRS
ncbi:MAG: enoyl-CoA hydratase, partial [Betaproteobacteria bacterium]